MFAHLFCMGLSICEDRGDASVLQVPPSLVIFVRELVQINASRRLIFLSLGGLTRLPHVWGIIVNKPSSAALLFCLFLHKGLKW